MWLVWQTYLNRVIVPWVIDTEIHPKAESWKTVGFTHSSCPMAPALFPSILPIMFYILIQRMGISTEIVRERTCRSFEIDHCCCFLKEPVLQMRFCSKHHNSGKSQTSWCWEGGGSGGLPVKPFLYIWWTHLESRETQFESHWSVPNPTLLM